MFAHARLQLTRPRAAHPDEPYWLGSAYYFDLLVRGETAHPDWRLLPARENPPVGKYLFGLALRAAGRRVGTIDVLGTWTIAVLKLAQGRGGESAYEKRLDVIARMSPAAFALARANRHPALTPTDVGAGRILAFSLGFLTALGIAAIGRRCGAPWAGRLAALLFVLHPAAVECYRHALVDLIALAFSTLAVLVLLDWADGPDDRPAGRYRFVAPGVLEGLALGLACGSKMNALVVVFLAGAVWLAQLAAIARGDRHRLAAWFALGLAFPVAAGVFVAANPALYADPIAGLRALFDEPAETIRFQAAFAADHAATVPAKLRTLASLLAGGWAGLLALVLVAAWRTVAAIRWPGPWLIVALWWWIALGAVGLWIPFAWRRYALPLLPPAALLVADGMAAIGRGVAPLLRRERALDPDGPRG
jgi:hypothetical protein